MNNKIDAVVLWVDGSDIEWLKEKNKYSNKKNENMDSSLVRYRDWGLLKYWFRALEQNAPWINRVFFITNGQVPEWLDLHYSKLRFVKHSDYMPSKYLPTFNSNPIELNLHRIKDLSENFLLFNDDTYIMNSVRPEDFFINGLPVYPAVLHSIVPLSGKSEEIMTHIYINDIALINRNFNIEKLKRNWMKWFLPHNVGIKNSIMSFFNSHHSGYVGFYNHHLPVPMRKTTLKTIWSKEGELLNSTSMNKFRSVNDVSQYVFRYWELANQTFIPINPKKLGTYYVIKNDIQKLTSLLYNYKGKMICLNDSDVDDMCPDEEYENLKIALQKLFDQKFRSKSLFEQ